MAVFASVILLLSLTIQSFTKRGRLFLSKNAKLIYWISVGGIFLYSLYLVGLQYNAWQDNELTKFFLPPYREIDYFFFYSLTRIFASYLISFVLSLGALFYLPKLNRRHGGQLFEKEEPYLAATSIFLVGHPGWIFYLLILISLYLSVHLYHFFRGKREVRLPLYNIWMIVAILSIFLSSYALPRTPLWLLLKI